MVETSVTIMVILLGLSLGSFCNVCIYRIPRNLSVVTPRSFCTDCKKTIAWYDNIPVLSWILLRGKCRSCTMPISPRYALVEVLSAIVLQIIHLRFEGWPGWMLLGGTLALALIVSTFIDFDIIPDIITLPGLGIGILVHSVFPELTNHHAFWESLWWSVQGAILGGGSLWLVATVGRLIYKKEVMGMGDVKLMAMVGALLGWKNALLAIFLGSLFGSLVGVVLIITRKSKWQSRIPFGPYLALGTLIAMLAGQPLIQWYMGFLVTGS
jgi:leader peptidase (prepilin peptidase) / N-methyltransferase